MHIITYKSILILLLKTPHVQHNIHQLTLTLTLMVLVENDISSHIMSWICLSVWDCIILILLSNIIRFILIDCLVFILRSLLVDCFIILSCPLTRIVGGWMICNLYWHENKHQLFGQNLHQSDFTSHNIL